MIQQQERLQTLLASYYEGSITEADAHELSFYLKDNRYDATISQILTDLSASIIPVEADVTAMQRVISNVQEVSGNKTRVLPFVRMAVAAAVLVMLCIGGYFLLTGTAFNKKVPLAKRYKNDVLPGGNKAMLTLSNGSTISLGDAEQGILAKQGGAMVVKSADGQLAYNKNGTDGNEVQYNILTTPIGGQYRITLPDGTSVWLNAGSSLRYPTTFTGKERKVELTGEGYFEVAKNAAMPFYVITDNGVEVLVLGTHFNVNAYGDDKNITTTLLEGAVMVKKDDNHNTLTPGQQAVAGSNSLKIVKNADVDAVVAWKKGVFKFNDANIDMVMKQLSRWYDIDIVYEGSPVKEYFNGTIPRNVPVSKVLELLELTGLVHFKIEGKTITVIP